MSMETVYSYEYFIPPILVWFLLLIFIIGVYLLVHMWHPLVRRKIIVFIISFCLIVFPGWILVDAIASTIVTYKEVYLAYHQNEYFMVEGEIENFEPAPFEAFVSVNSDTFTVQGVEFEVGNSQNAGLRKNAANGGPIHSEGQHVVIYYESIGGVNYIVRVDVSASD